MEGHSNSDGAQNRHRSKPEVLRVRREQLSVKVTEEACERFRRLAGEQGLTLGELFEQALDAWEAEAARLGTRRARPLAHNASRLR